MQLHKKISSFISWLILLKNFLFSEKRKFAISCLVLLVLFEISTVYLNVRFTKWFGDMYDSLQKFDYQSFKKLFYIFGILASLAIANAVANVFFKLWYMLSWRNWQTKKLIDSWIDKSTHYIAKTLNKEVDNPDQRIANDVDELSSISLNLILGFIQALLTLVSFTILLWTLSPVFTFEILEHKVTIPSFLLWVVLIYSLLGTFLTHKIGFSLSKLLFQGEKKEADLRYQLIRIRENSESVAMYDAGDFEKSNILEKFTKVLQNSKNVIITEIKIASFSVCYFQIANVLPILLLAPDYFAKVITLGVMMQAAQSFGSIQNSLSWIINSYTEISRLKAVVERLHSFTESLQECQQAVNQDFKIEQGSEDQIILENLNIHLPNESVILDDASIKLSPKTNYLLKGQNGAGKTTLFRALKGIWPYASGNITFPKGNKVMFLPQKPYMPNADLKSAIFYPLMQFSDIYYVKGLLDFLSLSHLIAHMDTQKDWGRVLSVGEQQKIAIIRAIINRPDILFLDESFSAMDKNSSSLSMMLLAKELEDTQIILITHKEEFQKYFNKTLIKENTSLYEV